MAALVIEHVPAAELPQAWRDQLGQAADVRVTVRIEPEPPAQVPGSMALADDPLFGMWRDREDMADVAGYIRSLRAPLITANVRHFGAVIGLRIEAFSP